MEVRANIANDSGGSVQAGEGLGGRDQVKNTVNKRRAIQTKILVKVFRMEIEKVLGGRVQVKNK